MACALVTGASRGIGLAVARRLAAGGYRVLSLSRSAPSEPEEGVHHVPCDLADVGALGPLVAGLGPADVLVNNAGVMHAPSWTEYPEELETATLAINLRAPIALMRHVGRGMADRGRGRIVNVASIAGQLGHPDVWYGATKAGLLNATRSFAQLLGPRGIQVTAVAPGPVKTAMLSAIPAARLEAVLGRAFTGRVTTADEVADAVVWLATAAPPTLNGTCIDINDGALMR